MLTNTALELTQDVHPRLRALINGDRKTRLFVVATGAGSGIQDILWSIPGCSAFFLGAAYPYAEEESEAFLGFRPEHFCNREMALDLAMAAYMRAWAPGDVDVIGLGLTASVTSMQMHRGEHRVHAAVMTNKKVLCADGTLTKVGVGYVHRALDGQLADAIGINLLLAAILPEGVDFSESQSMDRLRTNIGGRKKVTFEDATEEARKRFMLRPYFRADGSRKTVEEECSLGDNVFFPGSFNPPHEGHLGMADRFEGRHFAFMIEASPPHKPALTLAEMIGRAKMLSRHDRLFTEGAALFLDKARRFPRSSFIVGADALVSLLDPKWGPEIEPMLDEFLRLGITFHVFGRKVGDHFVDLAAILTGATAVKVLDRHWHLFHHVPGRWDISSTEVRARSQTVR